MAIRTKSSYLILAFLIIFLNVWSLNVRTESPSVTFEFIEVQLVDTSKESSSEVGQEVNGHKKKMDSEKSKPVQQEKNTQVKSKELADDVEDVLKEIRMENPNYDLLIESGMQEKTARILIKYVKKGGKIYDDKGLMRIYTMQESWIKRNEARLVYHKREKHDFRKLQKAEAKPFDINKADSTTWTSLRGIGPYYSKKIINFREKLGGFISVDQVGETYGLKDSVFQSFRHLLYVHEPIQQIDVLQASIEDLARHPYINWKEAKIIYKFIQQRSGIKDVDKLKKIHGIEKNRLEKMIPYLTIHASEMAGIEHG